MGETGRKISFLTQPEDKPEPSHRERHPSARPKAAPPRGTERTDQEGTIRSKSRDPSLKREQGPPEMRNDPTLGKRHPSRERFQLDELIAAPATTEMPPRKSVLRPGKDPPIPRQQSRTIRPGIPPPDPGTDPPGKHQNHRPGVPPPDPGTDPPLQLVQTG